MKASDSFTGLSPHLIGHIYPMTRTSDGTVWVRDFEETSFEAPLTQASLEIAPNWQSPFEGSGVESRFPALAQMAQSGMMNGVLNAVGHALPKDMKRTKALGDDLEGAGRQLVGRSGVTKLNSTQVFSGIQPIKIQITAFLRAFKDPLTEVERPLQVLQKMALPQYLAKDGVMAEFIKSGYDVLALMPSVVPTIVGFAYKNRIFQPMVIESVSDPLDAPIDIKGRRISATVQVTLCTLTALDRNDWNDTYHRTF